MGIFKALAIWLQADAAVKIATAEAIERGALDDGDDSHPEGNNFADAQIGSAFSTEPELHAGWRPSHQWWDDKDKGHISMRYTGHANS